MKIPLRPLSYTDLNKRLLQEKGPEALTELMDRRIGPAPKGRYYHWDKIRHMKPPEGLTVEEWWLAIKIARLVMMQPIPLRDHGGAQFFYAMPDPVLQDLHAIDTNASGSIEISEQVTNPNTRDRYLVSSLIEEAITSSQLEGASTTRQVADEMIRSGRKPRDKSEQMILNNFRAMRFIRRFVDQELTPQLVHRLHEIVTEGTLDDEDAEGRLRAEDDGQIHVTDGQGNILHTPPSPAQLPARLDGMCDFANGVSPGGFIHPVIRAILLHFWLAYDHPFLDGNGRTARALFYWSMLRQKYWLFEYVSISSILRNAPARYARAYLYTETDDNDLTYFIVYQLQVLQRAVRELHAYLERKIDEVRRTEQLLRRWGDINHRQVALLSHALKNPDTSYTINSHKTSHNVVYQTARADLLDLVEKGLLEKRKRQNMYVFFAAPGLVDRLKDAGQ